jgi:hypothetical protein
MLLLALEADRKSRWRNDMDKKEAKLVLSREMERMRQQPYSELRQWALENQIESVMIAGPSGIGYQIEIVVRWDSKPEGPLRVLAIIDDGEMISSFTPVCDDFLMLPNGEIA